MTSQYVPFILLCLSNDICEMKTNDKIQSETSALSNNEKSSYISHWKHGGRGLMYQVI